MELSIQRPICLTISSLSINLSGHLCPTSFLTPTKERQRHITLFTLLQEICRCHNQTSTPTSVSLDFVCAFTYCSSRDFHNQTLTPTSVSLDFEYASTYCSSRDFPHSGTQRFSVPLFQGYMEEDPGMWSTERLQNPTWSEHTCSSCSSSASSTSRQSYGLLAAHSGKCTRQRGLYPTDRLCNRDMYIGQILPIYLESLSGWGTQNQQPYRGLAQVEEEGENRTSFKLCEYWRIEEGAGSKWSKDVRVCNWWQEEKNSEEVSRGRRKTSASENTTDIWGENFHQYGDLASYILKLD